MRTCYSWAKGGQDAVASVYCMSWSDHWATLQKWLKLNTGPGCFFLSFLVNGQSSYHSEGEENSLLIIWKILPGSQVEEGWEILGLLFLKTERSGKWTTLLKSSGGWSSAWEQSQAETLTFIVARMKLSCFQSACRKDLLLSPLRLS